MKLNCMILAVLLLLPLACCGSVVKSSAIDLRTFIGCAVREFTFLAKKPGCRGLRVTTDACWGRCETWEAQGASPSLIYSGKPRVTAEEFFPHEDKYKCISDQRRSQKPVLEPPYIESYHRVCTYNETKMMTVKLPKCAPDVDPFYTYPVAIRCDCDICSTATTECETA